MEEIHPIERLPAVRVFAYECILLSMVLLVSSVTHKYVRGESISGRKLTSGALLSYMTIRRQHFWSSRCLGDNMGSNDDKLNMGTMTERCAQPASFS